MNNAQYKHLLKPRKEVMLTGDEVLKLAMRSVEEYHKEAGKALSLITDKKLLEIAYDLHCYKSDEHEVKYVIDVFPDGHTVHVEVYR